MSHFAPLLNKLQVAAIQSGNPRLPTAFTQALYLQGLIIIRVQEEKCTDMALAALARAWDVLENRKRVIRGVPDPGVLRPDLDPVQMMRAVKRSKSRKPIELSQGGPFTGPAEDVEEKPAKEKAATPTKPPEPATPNSQPIEEHKAEQPETAEPTE